MKTFIKVTNCLLLCMSLLVISCSKDEDDGNSLLSTDQTSISLMSAKNSSATFSITSSANWTISGIPDWLNLSSTRGNAGSNITVTVSAIEDNQSANDRTCELCIDNGNNQVYVTVKQLNGLASGCSVQIVDQVILYDSFSIKLKFGSNASFFYAGYLSSSAAGWTDDKIVNALESDFEALDCKDGYVLSAMDDFYVGQKVLLCIVAFDQKGNRGEVLKNLITIPTTDYQPRTTITNVTYDSSNFYWSTEIGAYADEYFMISLTGIEAYAQFLLFAPAETAMLIKDSADEDSSCLQSQNWRKARKNDTGLYVATWSRRNKTWSNVLIEGYWSIEESSTQTNGKRLSQEVSLKKETARYTAHTMSEYEKAKAELSVIRIK